MAARGGRAVSLGWAALLMSALISGCAASDHGQADALQACEDYARVINGANGSGPALATKLARAAQLAHRAASGDPRWQPLARSMDQLRELLSSGAADSTSTVPRSAGTRPSAATSGADSPATASPADLARAQIGASCGLAANGQ